ncbi:hypothetical protein EDB89DRAFT_1906376 [Lactarius sanguifluus]|nr:hypothetical protein EDB89DRAFT_1906376 [Lactarius sanguifluus]
MPRGKASRSSGRDRSKMSPDQVAMLRRTVKVNSTCHPFFLIYRRGITTPLFIHFQQVAGLQEYGVTHRLEFGIGGAEAVLEPAIQVIYVSRRRGQWESPIVVVSSKVSPSPSPLPPPPSCCCCCWWYCGSDAGDGRLGIVVVVVTMGHNKSESWLLTPTTPTTMDHDDDATLPITHIGIHLDDDGCDGTAANSSLGGPNTACH